MKGTITENKSGKGSKYILRFGNLLRRSNDKGYLERVLNGWRYKTDEGTFDQRDYSKDNPLGFMNYSEKWLKTKRENKDFNAPKRNIGYAQAFFGNKNIKDIQFAELEDFLNSPALAHLSGKTKHDIMASLHNCFSWICRREKRPERAIPMPDFPSVSFELGWRKILSKEDQAAVLDEVKRIFLNQKIWFAMYLLANFPKVRPGELIQVKEKDILLDQGIIQIWHSKEKNRKDLFLLDEDIEIIKSFQRGLPEAPFFRHEDRRGQFGENYLNRRFKEACKNLGIEGVGLYGGTKHSSVTAARDIMTPEEARMYLTGHKTNKAFDRYFQVDAAKQREASRRIRCQVIPFQGDRQVIDQNQSEKAAK
jgi:integrase